MALTSFLLTTEIDTPLGGMLAAAALTGICLLEFRSERLLTQMTSLSRRFQSETRPGNSIYLEQMTIELQEYFAGQRKEFTTPLALRGSPFQQAVWDLVRQIPYGETRSYLHVARQLGKPAAARAVGSANGSNPISIVIPCHRLVHTDGGLAGYGGGVWRKEWLLRFEENMR